jgi:hypothetical protein
MTWLALFVSLAALGVSIYVAMRLPRRRVQLSLTVESDVTLCIQAASRGGLTVAPYLNALEFKPGRTVMVDELVRAGTIGDSDSPYRDAESYLRECQEVELSTGATSMWDWLTAAGSSLRPDAGRLRVRALVRDGALWGTPKYERCYRCRWTAIDTSSAAYLNWSDQWRTRGRRRAVH